MKQSAQPPEKLTPAEVANAEAMFKTMGRSDFMELVRGYREYLELAEPGTPPRCKVLFLHPANYPWSDLNALLEEGYTVCGCEAQHIATPPSNVTAADVRAVEQMRQGGFFVWLRRFA